MLFLRHRQPTNDNVGAIAVKDMIAISQAVTQQLFSDTAVRIAVTHTHTHTRRRR